MQNKLLPCPFCGGEAKIDITGDGGYRVTCKRILGCGCKFEWFEREDEAIASWNTRKPMERIVEQLEEAKGTVCGHKDTKNNCGGCAGCTECKMEDAYRSAIEIVKGGVDNEN